MNVNPRIVFASLSAAGLISIAMYEGFRDTSYVDGVGVNTIGFGTTEGVKPGDRITVERALVRLGSDVGKFETRLRACIGPVPMFQREWDSYVSLAYNVGTGAVCGSSIVRKLQAGQYEAACKTILDFDKVRDCAKPKVRNPRTGQMECPLVPLRGLTLRRQAEFKTCTGG